MSPTASLVIPASPPKPIRHPNSAIVTSRSNEPSKPRELPRCPVTLAQRVVIPAPRLAAETNSPPKLARRHRQIQGAKQNP